MKPIVNFFFYQIITSATRKSSSLEPSFTQQTMREHIPLLRLWLRLAKLHLMVPSDRSFRSKSPRGCQLYAPAAVRIMAAVWNNHDFVRDPHKHLGLRLSSQVSCVEQYINSEGDKSACAVISRGDKNSPSGLLSCAICLWSWLCTSPFLFYA